MRLIEWWDKLTATWKVITAILILIVLSIILMVVVDTGIYFTNGNLVVGTDGDWIGFWGSFLGSLIGVAGAVEISYSTTKKQIRESSRQLNKQLEVSKENELSNAIKLNDVQTLKQIIKITNNNVREFKTAYPSYQLVSFTTCNNDGKKVRNDIYEFIKMIEPYRESINDELSSIIGDIKSIEKDWEDLTKKLLVVTGNAMVMRLYGKIPENMESNYIVARDTMISFQKNVISYYKNYVNG